MPVKVRRMVISEATVYQKERTCINKTNTIRVGTNFKYSSCIVRSFTQKGSDTHVSVRACLGAHESRGQFVLESTNYYAAAMEYVDKCLKKCNYELDRLLVQMTDNPFSHCKLERLIRCDNVEMGIDNIELLNWWIQKLPEKMKRFELYTFMYDHIHGPISSNFLSLPQIKQVEHLGFSCEVSLTDEQFLNLRNKTMSSTDVSVTNEGVNQFLRKWVKGKGNQKFEYVHFSDFGNQNRNIILQGLQAREWDDEFKREQTDFVKKFKNSSFFRRYDSCFQLNSSVHPFESITLVFGYSLSIVKTGTKTVKKGKAITSYSVPRSLFMD
ncbi:hypothetical protein CAEBREN_25620 [Caenorhabditis brenneri]|uniref:Sdz-33 F-box domain-containing protein n=1 Tax=Caenorhabditis brenneri TaxID=135651 RepID=G0MK02_CAEBE|nr:hypothetical protein CAEBREN_25620 [Caenorhabditis brenneri]